MAAASLKQLGPGVYAWIGAGGDSNAGAVVTASGLVAIDAQQSAGQGHEFRAAIEAAAGQPTARLVDTHFHLDHTAGNIAFADVPIVAQERTLALMNRHMGSVGRSRWTVDRLDDRLRLFFGSNIEELAPPGSPLHEWFVARVSRPQLDGLELAGPCETFGDRIAFHGPDGVVKIDYVGPAHCDGEVIVHLPKRKLAFVGDLVFAGRFPWLGDCDLDGWIGCLQRIVALDLETVIPGHGDVCTLKQVDEFRILLASIRSAVHASIRAGHSEQAAMREVQLPQYAGLPRFREWMPPNIRAVYRFMKQS